MKKLPKTIYVKIERDGGTEYFVADAEAAALVQMNETVKVGVYELVETKTAKGVASFSK